MSRGGQSFNIKKVVKWVIIITVIMAAIEIPFVYFYFKKEDKKVAVQPKPKEPIEEKNEVIVNQPSLETPPTIVAQDLSKQEVEPKKITTVSKDTAVQKPAPFEVKEQKIIVPAPVVKKPDTLPSSTLKPVVEKKTLTSAQMQDVVDRLNSKRSESGSKMKCVKIRQTASSNVSNGFKIADVLKSNGYIISGRETVSSKVKGILVSGGSDCLLVTVGSL